MRIVISILMFIIGSGCVVYSYIGSVLRLASDAGQSARGGDEAGALSMIIDFILSGEIPQLSGYLYGGLFLIVLAVVNLILNNPKDADREDSL